MFESGNFSMNKSEVSFSAIGADFALKEENRAVKVIVEIKDIDNNENVLSEYFLTAAKMGNIVERCCTNLDLDDKEVKKEKNIVS